MIGSLKTGASAGLICRRFNQRSKFIIPTTGDGETAITEPSMCLETTIDVLSNAEMEVSAQTMSPQPPISRHHLDETVRTPWNVARGERNGPGYAFHINGRRTVYLPTRHR